MHMIRFMTQFPFDLQSRLNLILAYSIFLYTTRGKSIRSEKPRRFPLSRCTAARAVHKRVEPPVRREYDPDIRRKQAMALPDFNATGDLPEGIRPATMD